jgi:lipopolysaccharide transport system ATP-binding protein
MSDVAIRVEGLGKQYRIGGPPERYATLRDQVQKWVSLRGLLRRAARAERRRLFWALKDVSFEVQRGEVVGIIGRNGAGKSTLLKILSRITEPTEGEAEIHGRVGSLLEVGTGFHQELTGRENVYLNGAILGMKRAEIARRFDEIVAFAEVETFIDTPAKHYSSGMYMRLAFAVAAHLDPQILIVDEVLAVGDAAFQKKCLGKMGEVAQGGRTVVFVSHNMVAVRNLCTKTLVLGRGVLEFDGPTGPAIERYLRPASHRQHPAESHVLYQAAPAGQGGTGPDIEIVRIELYGASGLPQAATRTWEQITFRVDYAVRRPVRNAHFCLELTDNYGRRLLSLETRTHTHRDDLGLASGALECSVAQLPLAPGIYALGAAVFVPEQRLIWASERLADLTVHPDDVFGHGHLPPSSHAAVITPHVWNFPAR